MDIQFLTFILGTSTSLSQDSKLMMTRAFDSSDIHNIEVRVNSILNQMEGFTPKTYAEEVLDKAILHNCWRVQLDILDAESFLNQEEYLPF